METHEMLQSKTIYSGVIFDITQRTVRLPNGKEALRDIVMHNGAAAVVALTQDGELLMVRQYREGAKDVMLEIPAGKLDIGEDPQTCAIRELEEETGYTAGQVHFMMRIQVAAAYCTEQIYLYAAENVKPGVAHPDADEFVVVETHPLPEVLRMIDSGEITDVKTIVGVLNYMRLRAI